MEKYIAEGLGTFSLTFVVALSLTGFFPVPTPVLAALVVGLFVYTIGHISGTHLNPAVTLGAWSIGKIKMHDAGFYILAQCIGAAVAMFLVSTMVGSPMVNASNSTMVGIAEMFGAFFLTFGIASVIYKKVSDAMSGIVIGGSLLMGIATAVFLGSNGVLNPAVAFGIGSLNFLYVVGPIIGAVFGMQACKYLNNE